MQIKKVAILTASFILLVSSFTLSSCKNCSKDNLAGRNDKSSSGDDNKTTKTTNNSATVIPSNPGNKEGASGSKTTDGLPKPPVLPSTDDKKEPVISPNLDDKEDASGDEITDGLTVPSALPSTDDKKEAVISPNLDDKELASGGEITDGLTVPSALPSTDDKKEPGRGAGDGSGDGNPDTGEGKGRGSKDDSDDGVDWTAMSSERFALNYGVITSRKRELERTVNDELDKAWQAVLSAEEIFYDLAGKVKGLVENAKSDNDNDIQELNKLVNAEEYGKNMKNLVKQAERAVADAQKALNNVKKEERDRAQVAREAVDASVPDALKWQSEDKNFTQEMPMSDEVQEAARKVTVMAVNAWMYEVGMYSMLEVVDVMIKGFKQSGRRDSDNEIVVISAGIFAHIMDDESHKDKYTRNYPYKQVEEVYAKIKLVALKIHQVALERSQADT
jgi:hypothetical protein